MTTTTVTGGSGVPRARTIRELRESGWASRPIKEEIRENAVARMRAGDRLVPSVLGYEDTVIPQLEVALLAGHDLIFLGERGQAKTRMIRGLVDLLDEWMPIIEGSEVNDDPYHPISAAGRAAVAEFGDATPIAWVHRERRYGEKLATPDTAIADLIGEVDPMKVARGRDLADELTIHFGLIPRTNRGIFAINELPDLAERIQVGMLNVLEERDIQIRGYLLRLPLDVMLVASANPEDYTNRGRLITPLKDRFGAQIRTHYPLDTATEIAIVEQEARPFASDPPVVVPAYMSEIVATLSQLARQSPHISQRSGVSVRLTVSNYESLVASAVRRCLRSGESPAVPGITDLAALPASTAGKIEIDSLDTDRGGDIVEHLVNSSVLTVFRSVARPEWMIDIVEAIEESDPVETGEDVPAGTVAAHAASIPALAAAVGSLVGEGAPAPVVASAVEFVLDGLHLSKRLNKVAAGGRAEYQSLRPRR